MPEQHVYNVSELNNEVKDLLENEFISVMIEGEISNFACPASGHWYFTLKDDRSQVRCAMFRMFNSRVRLQPENGAQVIVQAKVSLYPNRGDFQLIAQGMEEIGSGLLQKKFDDLKHKLFSEGLFEEKHKKSLPTYPQTIGVITSATGAAIRDILSVLKRRFACADVLIFPTLVQGESAAENIVKQINLASQRKDCDILVLSRGGGSLEDLWPFNEEAVARAIFACDIPLVSGVGHEVDFTIADFVADLRAPTPSAAAEAVTPDKEALINHLQQLKNLLLKNINAIINEAKNNFRHLEQHLKHLHPIQILQEQQQRLDILSTKLITIMQLHIQRLQQRLSASSRQLEVLSPLAILGRGYSILRHEKSLKTIKKKDEVTSGDTLIAQLSDGIVTCTVK
jgi:exodeoxyribonuclease VII large subunit